MIESLDLFLIALFFITVLPIVYQAVRNASAYRKCEQLSHRGELVSVIIPARNEESNIETILKTIIASEYPNLEVIVGNDHSTDATEVIVNRLAELDDRIKLVQLPDLPNGWGGKMHACWATAKYASGRWLLFIDADCQVSNSAIGSMVAEAEHRDVPFLSGFPYQETKTFGERLLIPLIFFVLLGFLSIRKMRKKIEPAYGASCGQVMLISADAYNEVGGHEAIQNSCHDGLHMPRLFRSHQKKTDIVDLSDSIQCRMYHSTSETIIGLSKNAKYGIGSPSLILVFTFMLLGGQVLPWILPFIFKMQLYQVLACIGMGLCGYLIRVIHCVQQRCSVYGAILHPVGIVGLMTIQWVALLKHLCGVKQTWKGRKID